MGGAFCVSSYPGDLRKHVCARRCRAFWMGWGRYVDVRLARLDELDAVMGIYDSARRFMREHGNVSQWPVGVPAREEIAGDIAAGDCYVLMQDGELVGVFCFLLGDDPTYAVIEDGSWRSDTPYGTIHRVASAGIAHGVTKACFDFCAGRMSHLRIDTHEDNLPMQRAIERYGFERRGIIHIADGSPRIAYDYLAE